MRGDLVYVAFGDSITDGYCVSRGFVSFLAEDLREAASGRSWRVVIRGMSGETSQDGLYRLERDVIAHDPCLVTINFGVNDAFSGISVSRFGENLSLMINRILDGGCSRIVLLSSEVIPEPWAEQQVLPYWEAMRQEAEDGGVCYADVNGWWRKELEGGRSEQDLIIQGDLHPNEEGHRLIAEAVLDSIKAGGLLKGL